MKFIELENASIDPGSPSPKVFSDDINLFVVFYSAHEVEIGVEAANQNDKTIINKVAIVKFNHVLNYKFGFPGDEALSGHPLYNHGLKLYATHYLDESPWIEELIHIDSFHPYHDEEKFRRYRHYVFTFHDNTLECIAKDYNIEYTDANIYDAALIVVQEMLSKYK